MGNLVDWHKIKKFIKNKDIILLEDLQTQLDQL